MAKAVVDAPELRAKLAPEAAPLQAELTRLASDLKSESPTAHRDVAMAVSESILDLDHVQSETRTVSLRLAQVLRAARARTRR